MDHPLPNGMNTIAVLDSNGTVELKKVNSNSIWKWKHNDDSNFAHLMNPECFIHKKQKKTRINPCCSMLNLLLGIFLLTIGIVTFIYPIYDFVLTERLKMIPGFPPFEQWVSPAPEVKLRVFIFTVENADAFLAGTDEKLKLKEIGPIVYREYLRHENVVFHENSTLSYTANRHVEFLPDENEPGILNKTITVPNFVILATAASLKDATIFQKIGFKVMFAHSLDTMFMNTTVYSYLWDYTSDLVKKVQTIAPFLVPTDNSGILYTIYNNAADRYNVLIGPHYKDDQFFEITSVNGGTVVPRFNVEYGDCNASIVGSTEGALYNTHLTKESIIWYWRKPLCRQVPLYFEKEVQKGAFLAYKYELREDSYDRSNNLTADCYKGFSEVLPDGLSDVSKCFFDMPFAASNPHFYGRYPNLLTNKLEGIQPNEDRHKSYCIVEPTMGIPIDQTAKSQSNVIIPDISNFGEDFEKFSNMALPTFWVEYVQMELTGTINVLLIFTLHILPVLQYVITFLLILFGFGLIILAQINLIKCTKPTKRTKNLKNITNGDARHQKDSLHNNDVIKAHSNVVLSNSSC